MSPMVQLSCHYCGKSFERARKRLNRKDKKTTGNYCELKCWYAYLRDNVEKTVNVCPVCKSKKEVPLSTWNWKGGHFCCSKKCAWVKERRRKTITCEVCGKEVEIHLSRKDSYCSRECVLTTMRNKVPMNCAYCNAEIMVRNCVAKASKTNKHFCSNKCQGKYYKGENHPSWKPERNVLRRARGQKEYQEWRDAVYKRDDYTCRTCDVRGTYLHAHHKKSFSGHPALRYKIDNGITLCRKCHGEIHGITYYKGNERGMI